MIQQVKLMKMIQHVGQSLKYYVKMVINYLKVSLLSNLKIKENHYTQINGSVWLYDNLFPSLIANDF